MLTCSMSVEHTHTTILTHISPYFAQGCRELRSCQVLSFLHNSEKLIFRFGPAVRSTDDISSYKVYIELTNIMCIQKNYTCAYVTLHYNELHRFESTMVSFFSNSTFAWFFSHVLIMYVIGRDTEYERTFVLTRPSTCGWNKVKIKKKDVPLSHMVLFKLIFLHCRTVFCMGFWRLKSIKLYH